MAKTTKSNFLQKAEAAHAQHKDEQTVAGRGGELPGGIQNGIAELTMIKIGTYQKGDYEGEPFFMAMGATLSPAVFEGMPIKGLLTSAGPVPLCDTSNAKGEVIPFAQNWDLMLRYLRGLGLDTSQLTPQDIVSGIDDGNYASGPVLEALVGEGSEPIRFRFSTRSSPKLEQTKAGKWRVGRKEYPTKEAALAANPYSENPRVWHEWGSAVEFSPEGTDDAVQDDTKEEAKWESDDAAEQAKSAADEAVEETVEESTEETAEEAVDEQTTEASSDDPDFLEIAKTADNAKAPKAERVKAEQTLIEYAKALSIDGHENMATWADVAQAIVDMKEIVAAEEADSSTESTAEEAEEEYSEEAEEWVPADGEIGFFHDPKSKTPVRCEFVKVYGKLEKVDLKRLDTNKIVKGVPFAKVGATDIPF